MASGFVARSGGPEQRAMAAEKTSRKQGVRGRPFATGQSGNPSGRPLGARNRASLAAEALLDGDAQGYPKAINLALAGNTIALRLCLERILPPRRERIVGIPLPEIDRLHRRAGR